VLDTEMLETSSWGECGNDDLPGDQSRFDRESLIFDSDPLPADLDCFGHPEVQLTLKLDRPIAALAIRLCEISPETGASHLVTYRFFNPAYRGGDTAKPQAIEPHKLFSMRVPLNLMGHTFKQGWRVRLTVSPSFYPTLWEAPEPAILTVEAGETDGFPASALILPGREERKEDKRAQKLLPSKSAGVYVNPDDYLPTLVEARPAESTRTAYPVTINGRPGMLTRKVFDSGRYQYGGPLQGLWVDQIADENFQMCDRRSAVASRLHPIDDDSRASRAELPRARRDRHQCVERSRRRGRLRVPLQGNGQDLYWRCDGNRSTFRRKNGSRRDRAVLDLTRFAGLAAPLPFWADSVSAALMAWGDAMSAASASGSLVCAGSIACGELACSGQSGPSPSGTPARAGVPVPQKGWCAPICRSSRRIRPAGRTHPRSCRAGPGWLRRPPSR
jgi:hypothetical protein